MRDRTDAAWPGESHQQFVLCAHPTLLWTDMCQVHESNCWQIATIQKRSSLPPSSCKKRKAKADICDWFWCWKRCQGEWVKWKKNSAEVVTGSSQISWLPLSNQTACHCDIKWELKQHFKTEGMKHHQTFSNIAEDTFFWISTYDNDVNILLNWMLKMLKYFRKTFLMEFLEFPIRSLFFCFNKAQLPHDFYS